VVHGGGKELSRWMARLGQEPKFIDGLRYTDDAGIELAEMVLSGKIRNQIVSTISRFGVSSVGLSGRDGGLCQARRIEALGNVGEIESVDPMVLERLLSAGYVPVVSSLASDRDGRPLNINADHMAQALATSLSVSRLVLLTDIDAVRVDGRDLGEVAASNLRDLLQHPDVKGGMLPKLRDALAALESGVPMAQIVNGYHEFAVLKAMLRVRGFGTTFTAD
jgi:acetylglutamate kinase